MITKVFSVYDAAAAAYLSPLFFQTSGMAIRAFRAAVDDPSHLFHKHAADYTLFELGTFDDSNAHFLSLHTPHSLGTALELKTFPSSPLNFADTSKS